MPTDHNEIERLAAGLTEAQRDWLMRMKVKPAPKAIPLLPETFEAYAGDGTTQIGHDLEAMGLFRIVGARDPRGAVTYIGNMEQLGCAVRAIIERESHA